MKKIEQLKHLFRVIIRTFQYAIRGKSFLVDRSTKNQRRKICASCKFRKNTRCGICGCIIRLKTMVRTDSCDVGFWK